MRVFMLLLACLCGHTSGQGFPCRDAAGNTRPMPGAYIPQCRRSGIYEAEQCHGSTGYCWCVDQVTGEEVADTKTGPTVQHTDCAPHALSCAAEHAAVMEALGGRMMPGAYAPQCDGDQYRPEQRHGSTGQSWCVDPVSGIKDVSSHLERGQVRQEPCPPPVQPDDESGPACRRLLEIVDPMPGGYTPQCTPSGLFRPEQCHASIRSCWCVDQVTGAEIDHTRRGPTEPDSNCRRYALTCPEEAAAVTSSVRPGTFVPRCEGHAYSPKQRNPSTGESWCVNFNTGEELPNTRVGKEEHASCDHYYYTEESSAASFPSVATLTLLMVLLGACLLQ